MSLYSVPHNFIAGTKASPSEVNENFEYITDILSNISESNNFCVNSGTRDANSNEHLIEAVVNEETEVKNIIRIVTPEEGSIQITSGFGSSYSISSGFEKEVSLHPYKSILPKFESNDDFNGFSCSTSFSSENAYLMFDKDDESFWQAPSGVSEIEVYLNLDKRYLVEGCYIKTFTDVAHKYSIFGSNDLIHWESLDEFTFTSPEQAYRLISSRGNYSSYKIHCRLLDSSEITPIRIQSIDFYVSSESGDTYFEEKQIVYLGENGLESRRNKIFRQTATPSVYAYYDSLIPEMTGNLFQNFSIDASGESTSNLPYMATDSDLSSCWFDPDSLNESWIRIKLPTKKTASVCKISIGTDEYSLSRALTNGKIQGSLNGSEWTDLCQLKNESWEYAGQSKLFYLDTQTSYFYYRIIGEAPFASIAEFQLYEKKNQGEYYLGEAEEGDIWFRTTDPFGAYILLDSTWEEYNSVPVGEILLDRQGEILSVDTYPYNQNGYEINSSTTSQYSGNILTRDSYSSIISSSGRFHFPNKLIIQYGTFESTSGQNRILYSGAFPHGVFSVQLTPVSENIIHTSCIPDNQGFYCSIKNEQYSDAAGTIVKWMAFGW